MDYIQWWHSNNFQRETNLYILDLWCKLWGWLFECVGSHNLYEPLVLQVMWFKTTFAIPINEKNHKTIVYIWILAILNMFQPHHPFKGVTQICQAHHCTSDLCLESRSFGSHCHCHFREAFPSQPKKNVIPFSFLQIQSQGLEQVGQLLWLPRRMKF